MGIFSSLLRKKTRCVKCGKTLYSRRIKSQTVISSSNDPRIWQNDLALECTSCGKIACNACAKKASLSTGDTTPSCPSCSGSLK